MSGWSSACNANFTIDALPGRSDTWTGTQTNTGSMEMLAACNTEELIRHVRRGMANSTLGVDRPGKN